MPVRVLATLAGFGLVGLALASLVAPGGAQPAQNAGGSPTSAGGMAGMAGMDMSPPAPPVPKLEDGACTDKACPIPSPGGDELAVAGRLGAGMAAAWVRDSSGELSVRVELLGSDLQPIREPVTFAGNPPSRTCGPGCWSLTLGSTAAHLEITAREHGHRRAVSLPLHWERGRSARARALIDQAVQAMTALIGVRLEERLATGIPGSVGSLEDIHYRLSAPNAMSATATGSGEHEITIGPTQWIYTPGVGWSSSNYNGQDGTSFKTSGIFTWHKDEQSAQLLSETNRGGTPVALIALMNPHLPAWLRLTVETRTGRVEQATLITQGTFTTDRFSHYGDPQRILPPKS